MTDDELKTRLKAKLNADEYCASQLRDMESKGGSYDELWEKKLYSAVSIFDL